MVQKNPFSLVHFDRFLHHKEENEKVLKFISKVEIVKPRFGNTYWKVDTTANELAFLKNKLSRGL